MLREFAEALETISHERPLLLVFEDLHWSDPSTLDVFSALAHRSDPASLLIVGTYRPVDAILADHPVKGLTRDLVARRRGAEMSLSPLDEHEVDTYLRAQLGGDPPLQVSALVHRRSEGNPLMVTCVADLLAQDCLARGDDGWELRRPLHETETLVPVQLKAILEARVDRLEARDLKLLECASVIGTPYRSVYGPGAPRAAHVYERAEQLCERLEIGLEIYPLLAGLFAFYIGRARYPDAREMASRMMRVAEPLGEPLILRSALLMTGIASLYSGRFTTALESMDRAIELSGDEVVYHCDHDTLTLCYLFSCLALHVLGRPEEARTRWTRGLASAQLGADTHLLTMALQFASLLDRWRGETARTREHALDVDAISEEQEFELWSSVTGWSLGWVHATEGEAADVIATMQKNLELHEASGTDAARTEYLAAPVATRSSGYRPDLPRWRGAWPPTSCGSPAVPVPRAAGWRWHSGCFVWAISRPSAIRSSP